MKQKVFVNFSIPLSLLLMVLIFSGCSPAASQPQQKLNTNVHVADYRSVQAQTILQDLLKKSPHKQHPRLMATADDFKRIQAEVKTDPNMQRWFSSLKTAADKILPQPVVKYELPDGVRLLDISRTVLTRTIDLSLMYRITGNRIYADRAWEELSTVADNQKFADWHPPHFLDTAEMTNAAAIGYDWLYDYLTPDQKTTLQTAIVQKGLTPALNVYRGVTKGPSNTVFWKDTNNNWNTVVNGGIGVGALAIADESPQTQAMAGEILQDAVQSIQKSLAVYAPDGGMPEGPGYWDYATSYMAYFISSMDTALGTDYGLSQMSGLSQTGYYPIYMTGAGGSFNLGDAGAGSITYSPQLFWLAAKYKEPDLMYFALKGNKPLDLIWYQRAQFKSPVETGLPLDKHYVDPATELVTMRSKWDDPNAIFAALHTGDNQANHGDLDVGDFVLDALGVRWAVELGPDDYNLPGYFDMKTGRWNYYRKRAEGQNLLLINPGQGPDQNSKAIGKIVSFSSTPQKAFAIADLTTAYDQQASTVKRGLQLPDNRQEVVLQDEVQLKESADVWWFMHTAAQIQLSPDGKTAALTQSGKKLSVRILSPEKGTFTVMDAAPLPSSPNPTGQKDNKGIRKLAIHLSGVTSATITVVFNPILNGQPVTPQLTSAQPLSEWK
ncbi:MAG: Heparinase II/III-like protein [Bacilli bacterium]|nr:Heparinase II/III-like protein [Bacilli bacterium]